MKLISVGLLFVASIAYAQPAKPCVTSDADVRWVVASGTATACFQEAPGKPEKCFGFSATTSPGAVAVPAKQALPKLDAEIRDDGGAPSACIGTKCKKLGKKTIAAIAGKPAPQLTGDGKLLVIATDVGPEAWSVAGDKQLTLSSAGSRVKNKQWIADLEVAAGTLIASWSECAGPCGRSVLVDGNGKNRGTWFLAGTAVPLAGNRLAILPHQADRNGSNTDLVIIDLTTAKPIAKLSVQHLMTREMPTAVVEGTSLDATTMVVAGAVGDSWKLQLVSLPANAAATLGPSYSIPICK